MLYGSNQHFRLVVSLIIPSFLIFHNIEKFNGHSNFIIGDDGVPVQVDGEAWIQSPGMIRIIHKNRMKMLCRNKVRKVVEHFVKMCMRDL